MADRIFTFGYEGLSLEAFINRLKVAGIKTVIDVRANPISRKRGFSKKAFAAALAEAGFVYLHAPAMGCPKPVRDLYKQNADWSAYTTAFLAHLESHLECVAELGQRAQRSSSCLVCFEADFDRCHRTFVARAAATQAGLQVIHLTSRTEILDAPTLSAA
jgi:uncharacterized protein (DUF488 family)